jgi:Protein of unknown function (DUF3060)
MERIVCEWCKEQNEPNRTNCVNCGAPLDIKDRVGEPVETGIAGGSALIIDLRSSVAQPTAPAFDVPAVRPSRAPWSMSAWIGVIAAVAVLAVIFFAVAIPLFASHGGGSSSTKRTISSSRASSTSIVPGGSLTVGEMNATKTVACNDGRLTVESISMTVTVTGHCAQLTVSGASNHVTVDSADTIDASGAANTVTVTGHCGRLSVSSGSSNHVTVDSADTIDAGGIDNVVIFHSGSPQISQNGIDNTVQQG